MTDPRLGRLRQRAHSEGDEGLEERSGHVRAMCSPTSLELH
jgi:hypothetical protein